MDNPFDPDYRAPEPDIEQAVTALEKGWHKGPVIHDVEQGSDEWHALRCGLITASEMKLLLTPTLKVADNDKTRAHLYELLAQRITKYTEPQYISDDMLRGQEDELYARQYYHEKIAPVEEVGFVTNDRWGYTLGYSPDGRVIGTNGGIEIKSRRQKYQVQTVIENYTNSTIPADYLMQHQTGLMVAEWDWIDFISYSGGLPLAVIRVWPDEAIQKAIEEAAAAAEAKISQMMATYESAIASMSPLIITERRIEQEMFS